MTNQQAAFVRAVSRVLSYTPCNACALYPASRVLIVGAGPMGLLLDRDLAPRRHRSSAANREATGNA
ncbi:MAG UNVERIFIED_CONTAM: hypothetical protein LVT10_24615 [Anaerolineae bacterium]